MDNKFTPTEFISVVNQTLDYAYGNVLIEGEVSSFKINQGKWVFFDLKDEESSVSCFMTLYQMRMPLEDGMKVVVRGTPKVTKWGKFSFTVQTVTPVGEGSLKKAYELLKKKLTEEGLFAPEKKRRLPEDLTKIGVISSTQAAGYADFIKIINARWGGLDVQVAHTQVQGLDAPDQMIRALKYFNERSEAQLIVMIRGGGSADDLACFNDEALVRAIAASKIPVATGIGHEIDESLADLAADIRASTPSNLAEMITPDKKTMISTVQEMVVKVGKVVSQKIDEQITRNQDEIDRITREIKLKIDKVLSDILQKQKILDALNPEATLKRGYSIVSGKISPGNVVKITTFDKIIKAKVEEVDERKNS
ncbi:exodeoxyribonuclease VII large subunit [Candidatus Saccharibacteria bacterium]|nr:exodeoxyribonuclease VII large subunit [Candidatus Saccharibacteria bacterium]